MPRKAKASISGVADIEPEAPRRSTRISNQEVIQSDEVTKVLVGSTGSKVGKRGRVDEGGDTTLTKKAKAAKNVNTSEAETSGVTPTLAHIDIGDHLPSVKLKNEKGEEVDSADLASEKGVILFLVPKADTPGCTNQACGFRDSYPDFQSRAFDVYCLSADTSMAQSKWQIKKELPYPLLSDPTRVLIGALGAADGNKTKRSHFIFEKGGKLVDRKIPVKPVDSPKMALDFVKNLSGNT